MEILLRLDTHSQLSTLSTLDSHSQASDNPDLQLHPNALLHTHISADMQDGEKLGGYLHISLRSLISKGESSQVHFP